MMRQINAYVLDIINKRRPNCSLHLQIFNGVSFIGENVESQEHILLNGP